MFIDCHRGFYLDITGLRWSGGGGGGVHMTVRELHAQFRWDYMSNTEHAYTLKQ